MPSALMLVLSGVAAFVLAYLAQAISSSVNDIPGPFFAKFTDLWRLLSVLSGTAEQKQLQLHRRHGPAVRTGPNSVTLSDPDLIRTIYTMEKTWTKSNFYAVNDVMVGKDIFSTTFSTRDEDWHTMTMKTINRYYSLTGVLRFEPLIDRTINVFLKELDERFVSQGRPCPIDRWLHYYSWDVIGEVTFSHRLGFLETATDIENLIKTGEQALDYFSAIGQMPCLDFFLDKNPFFRIGPPSFASAAAFSARYLAARQDGSDGHVAAAQPDFLDFFLDAAANDPAVDTNRLIAYLMVNVVAGSDTTAIELRAVVYYLCTNPDARRRLQAELDAAQVSVPVSWRACQKVPYLDAVIREALRLHPAVALPLERIVPAEGLTLQDGRFIPAGTVVGINPWVVHRDRVVYGEDADAFRPERWLPAHGESGDAYAKRLAKMRDTDLTFGYGKRKCTGSHLALVEIHKAIATLFSVFNVTMVDPSKMKVKNSWFHRQWDMDVVLERRSQ